MPHPGELLVPTYFKTSPKIVFGSIPSGDLAGTDHLFRYRMRQAGAHKLSLRAVATTGRVGYLFAQGSQWSLIVRNFAVNPSGEYVDVPWTEPEDRGYSTQACNIHNEVGSFNELDTTFLRSAEQAVHGSVKTRHRFGPFAATGRPSSGWRTVCFPPKYDLEPGTNERARKPSKTRRKRAAWCRRGRMTKFFKPCDVQGFRELS